MSEAPDFVEPLEAWRAWKVVRRDGAYSLGSVVQPTLWPAGEALVADCLAGPRLFRLRRRKRRHEAPYVRCDCGIYAAPLEGVSQYLAAAPFRGIAYVLGHVALWGTVVECERGYRASHADPARIFVPADAGEPWRSAGTRSRSASAVTASRSSRWPPAPPTRPVSSPRSRGIA